MILTAFFAIAFLIHGIIGFTNGDLITGFFGCIGFLIFTGTTIFQYMKYEIRLWKALLIACMSKASDGGVEFDPSDIVDNPDLLKFYLDVEKKSRDINRAFHNLISYFIY